MKTVSQIFDHGTFIKFSKDLVFSKTHWEKLHKKFFK